MLIIGSTSSTTIALSWSPPPEDQLNGVIRHYIVIVEEIDSGRSFTLVSPSPHIVLGDLHPFYTYNVSVCPVTVSTGPCAYFEPVQLPPDGMFFIVTLLYAS